MLGIFIGTWLSGLPRYLVALAFVLAMELLFPRDKPSLESRMRGVVIALLIISPATVAFDLTRLHLIPDVKPLIPYSLWAGHPILYVIVFFVAYDLLFYVMHRIQHKYFWNIHSVHHSLEELSAANFNNHPLQMLFDWGMIYLPLGILGIGPGLIVVYVVEIQGRWIHSSTRLNFGPLRWLLNDNRHHHIHHSREPEHWDKNFALFFPFWDLVMGTASMHDPKAWPKTGVHDLPEAKTLLGYLAQSLRLKTPAANLGEPALESTSAE